MTGEKGLSRSTMVEIARKVDLSLTMLYLFFKNKAELNGAMSLPLLGHLTDRLDGLLADIAWSLFAAAVRRPLRSAVARPVPAVGAELFLG